MSFPFEEEKKGKMSFLDVEISRENGKFVKRFTSNLPNLNLMFILILRVFYLLHKNLVCFINTLIYRCFTLCSDWSKCHRELMILKEIFQRNGYPKSFVNKCFKKFLDRLHIIKPTSATMEKKTLHLVLPYLGSISLQV